MVQRGRKREEVVGQRSVQLHYPVSHCRRVRGIVKHFLKFPVDFAPTDSPLTGGGPFVSSAARGLAQCVRGAVLRICQVQRGRRRVSVVVDTTANRGPWRSPRPLRCFYRACCQRAPCAQDVLQRTLATPSDGRAIQLHADDITTWADSGKQIFLLKGKVWIEQGALNVRAGSAVVWVDQANKKTSGIYALEVYGEAVALEDGKTSQTSKDGVPQDGPRAAKCASRPTPTKPCSKRRRRSAFRAGARPPKRRRCPSRAARLRRSRACFMQDGKIQQVAGQSPATGERLGYSTRAGPGPRRSARDAARRAAHAHRVHLGFGAACTGRRVKARPRHSSIRQRSGSEALAFQKLHA